EILRGLVGEPAGAERDHLLGCDLQGEVEVGDRAGKIAAGLTQGATVVMDGRPHRSVGVRYRGVVVCRRAGAIAALLSQPGAVVQGIDVIGAKRNRAVEMLGRFVETAKALKDDAGVVPSLGAIFGKANRLFESGQR